MYEIKKVYNKSGSIYADVYYKNGYVGTINFNNMSISEVEKFIYVLPNEMIKKLLEE